MDKSKTGFSHPKCYARSTGECSTTISGEHIISKQLLNEFEQNKTVKITGVAGVSNPQFDLRSIESCQSNILCERHNGFLSKFDDEAGLMYRTLKEFDEDFIGENPKPKVVKFDGLKIEKWMLKVVCGFVASKQVKLNGIIQPLSIPQSHIDMLFGTTGFGDKSGLYLAVGTNQKIQQFACIGMEPLHADGEVKCAQFLIHNLQFSLVIGKPDTPEQWGTRRVRKIHFDKKLVRKTITFEWWDSNCKTETVFTRLSTTTGPPPEWEEWMKQK